jgi:hypothetical protein
MILKTSIHSFPQRTQARGQTPHPLPKRKSLHSCHQKTQENGRGKEKKMKKFMNFKIDADSIFISDDAKYALIELKEVLSTNDTEKARMILENLLKNARENKEREGEGGGEWR